MEKWVTRFSRALMMGLAWGAVWVPLAAAPARLIVGELDPEHIGGPLYSGFICGSIFSALAGIATARRRLGDMSLARAAACGAASGLVTGALPFIIGDLKDSAPWYFPVAVIGSLVFLGAASAVASVWLARISKSQPVAVRGRQ